MSSSEVLTDDNGEASVSWTLGQKAGTNELEALVKNSQLKVTFTATGTVLGASMIRFSGEGSLVTVQSRSPIDLTFEVTDSFGNPVGADVDVVFELAGGDGQLSIAEATTGVDGRVTVTFFSGELVGYLASVKASIQAASTEVSIVVIRGSDVRLSGKDAIGVTVDQQTQLTVSVTDQTGAPRPGVGVTFSIEDSGGTLPVR